MDPFFKWKFTGTSKEMQAECTPAQELHFKMMATCFWDHTGDRY